VEARVRSKVSPCEICGRQNGTATGFCLVFPFLLVIIISPVLPTGFHVHGTLTKITVNLHAQWEAV